MRHTARFEPFRDMQVTLYHVFNSVPESYWDLEKEPKSVKAVKYVRAWEHQQRKEIDLYMQKARDILVTAGFNADDVLVRVKNRKRGIARDIITEAQRGYDMVITRRRGWGGIRGISIGSVAVKLFDRISFAPIVVSGRKPSKKKVLIAVDGSDSAMRAVDYVARMAAEVPHEITLLHVIRGFNVLRQRDEFTLDRDIERKWLELDKREMEPVFNEARTRLMKAGLESAHIRTKVITGVTSRAAAIVREARSDDFGTIVVGRRGLSGTKEFLMGRVSNKVIQAAKNAAVWVVS